MKVIRVRSGVAIVAGVWHIVVAIGDEPPRISRTTYASEAEAEEAATTYAEEFRAAARANGGIPVAQPVSGEWETVNVEVEAP